MTKRELISRLFGAHLHLKRREVEITVAIFFGEIVAALCRGDRVELRRFGAFTVKRSNARVGRNPRTGASVKVAEKSFPSFKTGKRMHDRLQALDRTRTP